MAKSGTTLTKTSANYYAVAHGTLLNACPEFCIAGQGFSTVSSTVKKISNDIDSAAVSQIQVDISSAFAVSGNMKIFGAEVLAPSDASQTSGTVPTSMTPFFTSEGALTKINIEVSP